MKVNESIIQGAADNKLSWYVMYTRPRSEKKLVGRLTSDGFEAYCPLIISRRKWSDRIKKVQLPLFPSYVFVRTSDQGRLKIHDYPGLVRFVFWNGRPAVIRDSEVEAINKISSREGQFEIVNGTFKEGDEVHIRDGIFKGLIGLVSRTDKNKLTIVIKELNLKIIYRNPA